MPSSIGWRVVPSSTVPFSCQRENPKRSAVDGDRRGGESNPLLSERCGDDQCRFAWWGDDRERAVGNCQLASVAASGDADERGAVQRPTAIGR